MKITNFYTEDELTIEQLEQILKQHLGDKYKIDVKKKSSNLAVKLVSTEKMDMITVGKNAYHRTVIRIQTIKDEFLPSGKRTSIYFDDATLAWWLDLLHSNFGLIGSLIIRLIYGTGDGFYQEIERAVKDNVDGKQETIKTGLFGVKVEKH